jgi:hypothetical protein
MFIQLLKEILPMRLLFVSLLSIIILTSQAKAIDVMPDSPRIITLPSDAYSVFVGNPRNATVVLDSPRTLVVTAGIPGATRLLVMGEDGKVLLNEMLNIAPSAGQGFVRVRNACINSEGGECNSDTMYYCADDAACQNVILQDNTFQPNFDYDNLSSRSNITMNEDQEFDESDDE